MKDKSLRSRSINLVLKTVLWQVTWDVASIANDRWSCWFRDKKDNKLNTIDYQSHHKQWSSNAFIRYNSDFDDDSAKLTA